MLASTAGNIERITAPPGIKAHLHLAPGRGDIDFPSVICALNGIGYDGFLSMHIISEKDRIVEAGRETRRKLEAILSAGSAGVSGPDYTNFASERIGK